MKKSEFRTVIRNLDNQRLIHENINSKEIHEEKKKGWKQDQDRRIIVGEVKDSDIRSVLESVRMW